MFTIFEETWFKDVKKNMGNIQKQQQFCFPGCDDKLHPAARLLNKEIAGFEKRETTC